MLKRSGDAFIAFLGGKVLVKSIKHLFHNLKIGCHQMSLGVDDCGLYNTVVQADMPTPRSPWPPADRRRVDSRDQARRLPHDGAPRRVRHPVADAQRQGLDRAPSQRSWKPPLVSKRLGSP